MAKLKLPSLEDASLLQKTLVYVVTFVLGSAGFVAIASLVVVTAAKALIPARNTNTTSDSSATAAASDKAADPATAATGKPSGRRGRPNKSKTPVDIDVPNAEETH